MTLSDTGFKVTLFLNSNIGKTARLKTKLLLHTNRKLYLAYGTVLCLVTLTDLWRRRAGLSASAELLVGLSDWRKLIITAEHIGRAKSVDETVTRKRCCYYTAAPCVRPCYGMALSVCLSRSGYRLRTEARRNFKSGRNILPCICNYLEERSKFKVTRPHWICKSATPYYLQEVSSDVVNEL